MVDYTQKSSWKQIQNLQRFRISWHFLEKWTVKQPLSTNFYTILATFLKLKTFGKFSFEYAIFTVLTFNRSTKIIVYNTTIMFFPHRAGVYEAWTARSKSIQNPHKQTVPRLGSPGVLYLQLHCTDNSLIIWTLKRLNILNMLECM